MSSEDPYSDGPKYKASSFLFGNVNKEGQIEDYQNDEDLKSINNLDQCHVKEVEETTVTVISESSSTSDVDTTADPSKDVETSSDVADYYDEEEVIPDEALEKVLQMEKPQMKTEESYDSPEPPDSDDVINGTDSNTLESAQLNSQYHESNEIDIDTSKVEGQPQSDTVSSTTASVNLVNKLEPVFPDSNLFGSTIPYPSVSEDATLIMPPPLHPAPISASRHIQSKVTSSRSSESPRSSPSPSGDVALSPLEHGSQANGLNTPLGSLMPAEYADVDIKDLFPYYDPKSTPRWGRLFRLPHAIGVYRELAGHSNSVNEVLARRSDRSQRLHLIYDDILDLGEVPMPDDIIAVDEVVELNTPPTPGQDYLAGSEHSWWRRAFKMALDQLLNTDQTDKSSDNSDRKTQPETGKSDRKRCESDENDFDHSDIPCANWRFGPAKYWYDQLGLPVNADILNWNEWRRQAPSVTNIPAQNTNQPVNCLTTKTENIDERVLTAQELEPVHSVKDEPKDNIPSETSNNNTNHVCDTTGKEKLSQSPIVISENLQFSSRKSSFAKPSRDHKILDTYYPYQFVNWEDDIIYDPQLSANKINQSSKVNAAYAGWIPSQHCRTMAAFQDAYQNKFPFIVGSKILNNLTPGGTIMENLFSSSKEVPPTNPPYAIFPVENKAILTDNWIYDIIYDSELPADQLPPPFLLTLDRNDEACVMESIDDTVIASAIFSARSQRQKRLANRGLDQNADELSNTATGSRVPSRTDDGWSHSNLDSEGGFQDPMISTASSKPSMPMNRASLQVTFGLASTRGMLTGALAKDEKGAEKAKMILGKHGLLAEDDWQADQSDKLGGTDDSTDPLHESNELSAEGNALASAAAAASGIPPKDPLNLSNDEFYALRSGALGIGGLARCGPLQHSTPAVELWPPFFPTFMSPLRLRQFHRVPLKRYVRGPMSQYNIPFSVTNLTRHITRKMREREEERAATGGGEIFFMRTPADLSGSDGDVVLFEFSEEYPPLMAQIGMATRVINYYRPLTPRDRSLSPAPNASNEPPDLPYGSLVYVGGSDSPFLGVIRPGGCLQTLENSMYRSPIYPHSMPVTDFLLIRNRNGINIRRVNNAFTVGQEVPLMEVPGPNSKRANNFVRDFLQVFILRLFLRSTDEPKRIKMEEIRKAFPNHSESSVRKRLKVCADFKRTGSDASWWVLRSDYRLPSEEEVRYLVSPEDCCAHYSMLAAELRLKDAGYGEKYLFVLDENPEDEEDKEGQPKMEDEVRAAPWNTTRAYLASQRGGCFLELHGVADPTGCGEAFSYSKTSAKPGALFRQAGGEVARGLLKGKRTVTGTDADLRKLHLRDARALLRSFGISEADLKTFKRWEIIDMVRFTSTERAKQGEEESSAKFARGNRLSMGEQIRCYREECQRIFDLQNRVLSNPELLSSDEEVSSEDDEDEVTGPDAVSGSRSGIPGAIGSGTSVNSIGGVRLSSLSSSARSYSQVSRNIESVLSNRISSAELEHRREEEDRAKLKRALESGEPLLGSKRSRKTNPAGTVTKHPSVLSGVECSETAPVLGGSGSAVYDASANAAGTILDLPPPWRSATKKMLRIMRTYSEDGHQYTRTELVPWSPVVEIYLKIRQTRDDEFIHNFVDSDDQFKEQQRREKRRLQDQLRRLRKQQAVMRERGNTLNTGMKSMGLANSAARRRRHKPPTSALVKMRCGACGQTGHMRTNKECPKYGQSGAMTVQSHENIHGNVRRLDRSSSRLRTSGSVRGNIRESGIGDFSSVDTDPSGHKLDATTDLVAAAQALASRPVCELLAEQEEEEKAQYGGLDQADLGDRMHGNVNPDDHDESSMTGFGENDMTVEGTKLKLHSGLTKYIQEQNRRDLKLKIRRQLLDRLDAAAAVVQSASSSKRGLTAGGRAGRTRRTSMTEDEFPTSVKHRGNRRRIDPRVALNHIFEGIYKSLTQISGYKIFMHPVKEKDFPNYYSQIDTPMDLSQIRMKINENAYATREEFLSDIRLIYNNSLKFNGRHSSYTETAMKMCSHVMEQFCHKELKLMRLESLVNPLLDEDDLVGLSYLLQQAIESMRSVEHSRPFHTPVDKRRYPDYYKIITNPMDLSTLEKLVKENRFHSRDEFFVQVQLILSNCITFNGNESPLTEIAHKMLAAAQNRLEQDRETLETIEANIRRQLDTESYAESIPSQSGMPESHSLLDVDSQSLDTTKQSTSTLPTRTKPLKRKIAKTITASDLTPGKKSYKQTVNDLARSDDLEPHTSTTSDVSDIIPGHGRSLRQRSAGAWYGVDLEYDDDDDDDDDNGEESDDDDEGTDASRTEEPPQKRSKKQYQSNKPWLLDEDSLGDMNYNLGDYDQTETKASDWSHGEEPGILDQTMSHDADTSHNQYDEGENEDETLHWNTSCKDDEQHQTLVSKVHERSRLSSSSEASEPDSPTRPGHDDDELESSNVSHYEDSAEPSNWVQYRNMGEPEQDLTEYFSNERGPVYVDEETRFSAGNSDMPPQTYSQLDLNDDLVAQDLKLTDSEEDSSLSGQGGELCTENELAMLSSSIHTTEHDPISLNPYQDQKSGDVNYNPQPSGHETLTPKDPHERVAFFISDEESN